MKKTDWEKGDDRKWGRKEREWDDGSVGVCVCECWLATHTHPSPAVMRQTNELAFYHAGHMCVWLTETGAS